jgi:two-component system alkaline phosphatase synthesis response regulator PhoP
MMEEISFYNPGVDLIEAIRLNMPDTPVILVTAPNSPYMQALGRPEVQASSDIFENGNYVLLTIPSSTNGGGLFARLQNRLKRILTKQNSGALYGPAIKSDDEKIQIKDLLIDVPKHEVFRSGARVELTLSEFNLLVAMASRNGAVLDYVTLVRKVLGYDAEKIEAKELIKRHVYALRQKIEPTPSKPHYILNVRGVGYRMAMV